MDASNFSDFSAALRKLAHRLGKRSELDTEAVTEAFEDLHTFPWPVVLTALETLRKTSRFFPRPQQLIDACYDASREYHSKAFIHPENVNHEEGRYACDICQDTGFERGLECNGSGVCHIGHCGQPGQSDQPHTFTRRCKCRPTNPVLIRERALSPRFATTDRS